MPILVAPTVAEGPAAGPGVPGALVHAGQLTLGGITLGVADAFGVEWVLTDLTGWFDAPPSTGAVDQRSADHGGWTSPAFYAPRSVGIEGYLLAGSWALASDAIDRLMDAVSLSSLTTLYVTEDASRTLQADVRQDGDPLTTRLDGWAQFSLSLIAPDPRRYSVDLTTDSTSLPSTTGGLAVGAGLSLPVTVGATSATGVLTATNAGNFSTRPMLEVVGPCPAGAVTHLASGRTLRWPEAIPAGRSLLIDTDRRRALLDGTAPRVVTGTWFEYEPGDNEIAFSAGSYDPDALLISQHRSAYR